MNWDDLRVALAVHRCGSYAKAGAELRIDETTVARRLARLQEDLGVTLFEAVDGERRPTRDCEDILRHADQMLRHADRIAEHKADDGAPAGRYRIAATDSVSATVLAPNAPDFLSAHPGITLQIMASTDNVNFSRWEADLAVRLAKPDKGDFAISKLADMRLYLFEPADRAGTMIDGIVCAYPEELRQTPEVQHLIAAGLQEQARLLTKNLLVIEVLLRSGTCSAILPDYMCAAYLDDPRFRATELAETREIWLLVQHHLKQDPGARAVIDWLKACFARDAG